MILLLNRLKYDEWLNRYFAQLKLSEFLILFLIIPYNNESML